MELDMYGDPVKDCCVKDCKASAVIIEKGKSYCPDHYAEKVLKMSSNHIPIIMEVRYF